MRHTLKIWITPLLSVWLSVLMLTGCMNLLADPLPSSEIATAHHPAEYSRLNPTYETVVVPKIFDKEITQHIIQDKPDIRLELRPEAIEQVEVEPEPSLQFQPDRATRVYPPIHRIPTEKRWFLKPAQTKISQPVTETEEVLFMGSNSQQNINTILHHRFEEASKPAQTRRSLAPPQFPGARKTQEYVQELESGSVEHNLNQIMRDRFSE